MSPSSSKKKAGDERPPGKPPANVPLTNPPPPTATPLAKPTSDPRPPQPPPEDPKEWSPEHVLKYLKDKQKEYYLTDTHIGKFKLQEVAGRDLLKLIRNDLRQPPYDFADGTARRIEDLINALKNLQGPRKTHRLDDNDDERLIKGLHPPHKPYRTYTILENSSGIAHFWSNLLNAEYDEKTRKLALPENTQWLGGVGISTGLLYIREHYERLWSKICWGMSFSDNDVKDLYIPNDADKKDLSSFMTESGRGFKGYIVNGTPGIGKSCFGLYILWRLRCNNDKPVVWYAGDVWYVFQPDGSVSSYSSLPIEYLHDKLNWFLVDARKPPNVEARTILLTSPDRQRFKEFANLDSVRMLYMPLWDEAELLALRDMRYVLAKAQDQHCQAEADSLVTGLRKRDLVEIVQKMADNTYPYGIVSGRVIHMEIDDRYGLYRCRFASELIATAVIGREGDQRWLDMLQFLKDTAGDSTYAAARGFLFDLYAHIRLRKGGKFRARKIAKDALEVEVTIRQSTKVHYFHSTSDLTRETRDYCQPYARTYEGIDSLLLPSSFFQITVAKTHGIDVKKLEGLYHLTTEPRLLYFVVPEDVFQGNYNTPQPLKQSGRVARLDDWRTKIEQWVLCMDFPGSR